MELGQPCQGDGRTLRSRTEQRPRFDGTCDPPTPKLRETDGHFVPTPTDLEKAECSSGKARVIVLKTGLDDVEKRVGQQLRWETGDRDVSVLSVS